MLYVYSSNVRQGKYEEFEDWLHKNIDRLSAAHPGGWKLLSVYSTVFGLGGRHLELHWEIDNYAAFDSARAAANKQGDWFTTLQQIHSYLDPASGEGRVLSKLVGPAVDSKTAAAAPKLAFAREGKLVGC
jgi:hypothetical protein